MTVSFIQHTQCQQVLVNNADTCNSNITSFHTTRFLMAHNESKVLENEVSISICIILHYNSSKFNKVLAKRSENNTYYSAK